MKWIAACSLVIAGTAGIASAEGLPRTAPEAQGVASAGILEFVEAADSTIDSLHSLMIVRHGKVVAEGWWTPYAAESPHVLFSLSKSFTSTAVGLAIGEGKLSLDDPVLKFFPEDAPAEPSDNLKAMRVSDLLRMSTGHQAEPRLGDEEPWTKTFLAQPVPFKPGTHFLYNTPATYMQSAIVQKATGQTVLDYLTPRLFEPLGIENPTWGTSPQGISLGGYGLSVRTEDIAKFGQLYLQKGEWDGKTIVPDAWVEAATKLQTSNGSNPNSDWDQGYGYQFWRSRNGAYRGDGAFGQYCVVMPDQDAVIAITSGVRDMQAVLNLVWDKLLPAMSDDSLAADESAERKLRERLSTLTLKQPEGQSISPIIETIAGRRFEFPENAMRLEAVTFANSPDGFTLAIDSGGRTSRVRCGAGTWEKGRLTLGGGSRLTGPSEQAVAASGAWTDEKTYTLKLCMYETPFSITQTYRFDGNRVKLESQPNVGFGPAERTTFEGVSKDE